MCNFVLLIHSIIKVHVYIASDGQFKFDEMSLFDLFVDENVCLFKNSSYLSIKKSQNQIMYRFFWF
jgi:hypothetical protein